MRPAGLHAAHQRQRLLDAVFEQFGGRDLAGVVALAQRQLALEEERFERVG